MSKYYWSEICSLIGCTNPKLCPHHHHSSHGHLTTFPCKCTFGGKSGTSKKEHHE